LTTRITTIVPTYRRPVLLKRAVLSVLNQSFSDFAVRILDNASGDETEQVARALMRGDSRVEYHRHPENIGSLQNMIYGMSQVATPYFSILCDDDVLMPDFFEAAVGIHERAQKPLAFVGTRVVAVDETGRFQDPWPHPREERRLSPPEGVTRCVKNGMSLPGVVYRTSAIQSIGMPRPGWWNWTESGWHALMAANYPITLSPELGAVVFVHPDSGSKRMNSLEFRISWFQMLSDIHRAAVCDPDGESWWHDEMLPVAYNRFFGSVVRLCSRDGSKFYERLGALGVACGLNARGVSGSIVVARAVAALGIGEPLNGAVDWVLNVRGRVAGSFRTVRSIANDVGIEAASRVFSDLNRQAGLA
jgi:glycosyltransferase involved in cell wall biosynthesis